MSSLTLAIPDHLADALTREANRLGMSLPDYAIRLLTTAQPPTSEMRTGAEIVAYWQAEGLIGTRTDPTDSPVLARQLREQAQCRGA